MLKTFSGLKPHRVAVNVLAREYNFKKRVKNFSNVKHIVASSRCSVSSGKTTATAIKVKLKRLVLS